MSNYESLNEYISREYTDDENDLESTHSYYSSTASVSSSSEYSLTAQEQWDESMKQIQALVSFVIFPLIGKLLGRRFSKIVWRRFANWWWP